MTDKSDGSKALFEPAPEQGAQWPLSVLIDQMCDDVSARDAAFVRRFSAWMHRHTDRLRLEPVEALQLEDVVVTFQMKSHVSLVVTGYLPGRLPGEVTVSIKESEFPFVNVELQPEPSGAPYEMCTMDYALAGTSVEIVEGAYAGQTASLIVAATFGERQTVRLSLKSGVLVTVPASHLAPLT